MLQPRHAASTPSLPRPSPPPQQNGSGAGNGSAYYPHYAYPPHPGQLRPAPHGSPYFQLPQQQQRLQHAGGLPPQGLPRPLGPQHGLGGGDALQTMLPVFPSRPGHPICDFYQKTGHCKACVQCA